MHLTTTPATASSSPPDASVQWVVCLCADWCGLCRDYAEVFAQMAARYPGSRFAWLDIEDEAELVGDIDVETFPTLLVADAGGTRFLGPLMPQAQTLARLLDSLAQPDQPTRPHSPATQAVLRGLAAAPQHWIKAG
ncbi:thioredoxin family protein [Polaromonas sp. JS666]|uniref:thioredoxin family protein n=1 Tax=Polaromonas sp. (strain JS666 / ATCC BAA-500) TaxID=296591 RepID=UPI00087E12A5|nr:thioredoxin family protein [Polaromonas sp. JS666]SDM82530.1 Thioredoxin [Polaromonas sp. JS666]